MIDDDDDDRYIFVVPYFLIFLQSNVARLTNVVRDNVVKVIVLLFSNISQERRKDAIVAILLKAFFDTRRSLLRELTVCFLDHFFKEEWMS